MSKLVIHTQFMENYGVFEGDGSVDRWKNKGGETYVLPDLKSGQLDNIKEVAAFFAEMVSYEDEATREYVISWSVEEDEAEVCEEWETPWTITYDGVEFFIERFIKAEPYWSGDYAGKFEKRPISMGSLFDPNKVVIKYVEKEAG